MPKQLWAPWRLEYVSQADELPGCPLCAEAAGEVEESLVVHRGRTAFALLNKYPYSSGHLILAPYAHVGELEELGDETALELHHLGLQAWRRCGRSTGPRASISAATSAAPRGRASRSTSICTSCRGWAGDTSFMPVLGDVKVMPEHLLETRDRLREAWPS